jgi:prevent-host-death family protein
MPATLKLQPAKSVRRVVHPARAAATPPLPTIVNVHEAKTQLSRLLARVEAGEEITIARAGQPFARLVPLASAAPSSPRVPGRFKGMFGPLTTAEALAPLPPEFSGLMATPTDPLSRP